MKIKPSSRPKTSLSTWEVRDNKNKLVGTFDVKKDKDGKLCGMLEDVAKIKDIGHDLFDVRQRVKDLIHCRNAWQINDRALQACDLTRQALDELDAVIEHIKSEYSHNRDAGF